MMFSPLHKSYKQIRRRIKHASTAPTLILYRRSLECESVASEEVRASEFVEINEKFRVSQSMLQLMVLVQYYVSHKTKSIENRKMVKKKENKKKKEEVEEEGGGGGGEEEGGGGGGKEIEEEKEEEGDEEKRIGWVCIQWLQETEIKEVGAGAKSAISCSLEQRERSRRENSDGRGDRGGKRKREEGREERRRNDEGKERRRENSAISGKKEKEAGDRMEIKGDKKVGDDEERREEKEEDGIMRKREGERKIANKVGVRKVEEGD
ncbi:hypothetical protein LSTR_LSTR012711 [Laodelphax striatellus]|uniref:Uncharacterized protein n=1 Tax=Laodelphax striatellus TaxID=195883 RepID=A0A482WTK1_LAOST|nr:hypothetical protein LSTR_LSTR012711 [Laodelphax striatellus]